MRNFLIIDDHSLFADSVHFLLKSMYFDITTKSCASPESAISEFRDFLPNLIILDHFLADEVGLHSIHSLRQAFAAAPILVVSGETSSNLAKQYISQGASGFVSKSSGRETFISAMDIVLSGGLYIDNQSCLFGEVSLNLSKRQREVLSKAIKGAANKVIAEELEIAEGTVKAHLFSVYKILGVKNKTEAANFIQHNNIDLAI